MFRMLIVLPMLGGLTVKDLTYRRVWSWMFWPFLWTAQVHSNNRPASVINKIDPAWSPPVEEYRKYGIHFNSRSAGTPCIHVVVVQDESCSCCPAGRKCGIISPAECSRFHLVYHLILRGFSPLSSRQCLWEVFVTVGSMASIYIQVPYLSLVSSNKRPYIFFSKASQLPTFTILKWWYLTMELYKNASVHHKRNGCLKILLLDFSISITSPGCLPVILFYLAVTGFSTWNTEYNAVDSRPSLCVSKGRSSHRSGGSVHEFFSFDWLTSSVSFDDGSANKQLGCSRPFLA